MNLGELYIYIGVDDSPVNTVEKAFQKLQETVEGVDKTVNGLNNSINSLETSMVSEIATGFSKVEESGSGASDSTKNLAEQLQEAVTKGELFADVMEKAFSTVVDLAKSAANAVVDFISSSVDEFAQYEQNVESMNRTFGNYSSEFQSWMQENSAKFGLSVNEMMEHANKTGVIIQKDSAQRRAEEAAGEEASTEYQSQQLDERLENLRTSLSNQLAETRESQQAEYNSWKNYYAQKQAELKASLDSEYDMLKDELDARLDAEKEANEREYRARKQQLDDSYDALKDSLDKEVEAFTKATDARVKEIDREYTERMKLIDEEKYKQLKALQDQIDALDEQNKQATRVANERKDIQKKADLEAKLAAAVYQSDRDKIQRQINELEISSQERKNKEVREDQKSSLKKQMTEVREHFDNMKTELKNEQSEEVSKYKAARADELSELKSSNEQKLKERKRANEEELYELKNQQKQEIDNIKAQNESILKDKKANNQAILNEQKAANNEQLNELKRAQSEELREIQAHNKNILREQQNLIKEQKKSLKSGGTYAEITDADQKESVATLEKLFEVAADVGAARNMTTNDVLNIFESMNYGRFATFDNLGLGYANKTGIQNMVADMGKQLGRQLDPENFSDVAVALDQLVKNYNMSGRASKESVETISGSLNALKTNWKDFKLALATEGTEDDDFFLNQLFYGSGKDGDEGTVFNFVNKLLPVVKRIIDAVVKFVQERGPEIVDRIKSTLSDSIPQNVKEELGKILTLINSIIEALGWCADNIDAITTAIEVVGAATGLGIVLSTILKIKEAVEFLSGAKGIKSVTDAIGTMGQAAGGAAGKEAIGGLGEAAAGATAAAGGGGGLASALGEVATGFLGIPAAALGATIAIGNMLYAYEQDTHTVENFANAHEGFANAAQVDATETANVVQEQSQRVIDGHTNMGQSADELKQTFDNMSTEMQNDIASMSESTKTQAESTGNWTEAITNFFTSMQETTTTSSGEMKSVFLTDLEEINTSVSVNTASMDTGWAQTMENMKNNSSIASSEIKTSITATVSESKSSVDELKGEFETSGSNLMEGLKGGIEKKRQEGVVETTLNNFMSEAVRKFKESLGIHSPSTVFSDIGDNIIEGLNNGITETWNRVSTFFSNFQGNLMGYFSNAGQWLVSNGSNIMTGLYNGLVSMWNEKVAPFVRSIGSWIHNNDGPEQQDRQVLFSNGQWMMQGLFNGLYNEFNNSVAPYVEGISNNLEGLVDNPSFDFSGMYSPMKEEMSLVEASFKKMADDMSRIWKSSLMEMADETRNFANYNNNVLAQSNSVFAQSMMNGISSTNRQFSQFAQQTQQTMTATLELDRVQFGRLVYQLNGEESKRVGVNIIGGYV